MQRDNLHTTTASLRENVKVSSRTAKSAVTGARILDHSETLAADYL
jgi:hypothetical protein